MSLHKKCHAPRTTLSGRIQIGHKRGYHLFTIISLLFIIIFLVWIWNLPGIALALDFAWGWQQAGAEHNCANMLKLPLNKNVIKKLKIVWALQDCYKRSLTEFWYEQSACAALRRCCGTKCPLFLGLFFSLLSFSTTYFSPRNLPNQV